MEGNDMTMTALDRIDIKILNELQQNASLTNVELASRVNLSPSPCLARVKNLEKIGVIDRRIAVLDPAVLGIGVTAFIQIKLEKQAQISLENFTRAIDRLNQVMECYLTAGDHDYLLRVMVSDIEDLEDLIVNVTKHLKKGARIRLNGLGILQVKKRAARMGRNPATGEAIKIKASKKVAFRASKDLKEAI